MTDDKLLTALGRVAAKQASDGERWEALATEPESAGDGADSATEDELARRLFAPPSDASVERMTQPVLDLLATNRRRAPAAVPLRRRVLPWAGLAGTSLAAAAAVALYLGRSPSDLPNYTLSIAGGLSESRGGETRAPSEPLLVAPGTRIVLVARPDTGARESVRAATFVVHAGGVVAVPSVSEASEKGVLRVTVLGDDVMRVAGSGALSDLLLVVDRSSEADHTALTSSDASRGRDWIRFTVPIRAAEPPR